MPAATRKKKGSPAAADSAETVSVETVPAPEGAEEEIVETELEVSGGTLEVTQLAAAQAVQAKAIAPLRVFFNREMRSCGNFNREMGA